MVEDPRRTRGLRTPRAHARRTCRDRATGAPDRRRRTHQAAEELGEHYAQGRLTTEEHSERLDRILEARTRAELAPIFSDLPGSTYAGPGVVRVGPDPGVGYERAARSMAQPYGRPRARSGRRGLPG